MSGIYIHIPFCKKACHYCNFHFSTSLKLKDALIQAIITEIKGRTNFLPNKILSSIYFGGGTPSLMDVSDLKKIIHTLSTIYQWDESAEITLEANPDDLTSDKIKALYDIGINRLSIGIQSFHDEDLLFMNRAHNAHEAIKVVDDVMKLGFQSITCDLIYGSPTTTDDMHRENIRRLVDAGIPHISAYSLTVEEGTALNHMVKHGKAPKPQDDVSIRQFDILMDTLDRQNYDHYEISNYALPGHQAIHNTSYWEGQPYLGIGPSAHSYDGKNQRTWNIANNPKYIKAIASNSLPITEEVLSQTDLYNEYILTRIRTSQGMDKSHVINEHKKHAQYFEKQLTIEKSNGNIQQHGDRCTLTKKGKYIADNVSMRFFILED